MYPVEFPPSSSVFSSFLDRRSFEQDRIPMLLGDYISQRVAAPANQSIDRSELQIVVGSHAKEQSFSTSFGRKVFERSVKMCTDRFIIPFVLFQGITKHILLLLKRLRCCVCHWCQLAGEVFSRYRIPISRDFLPKSLSKLTEHQVI
jgi:hypothetical protein